MTFNRYLVGCHLVFFDVVSGQADAITAPLMWYLTQAGGTH